MNKYFILEGLGMVKNWFGHSSYVSLKLAHKCK